MILLADGGSTNVYWRLIDKGNIIIKAESEGINPFFRTREDISEEIRQKLLPKLNNYQPDSIYFYGAGCANPEKNEIVRLAIADNFNTNSIKIESDLLGAATGLCGNNAGIVCILGTGSNSCFYDGRKIVEHIQPLGFILGDEGSGAVLGRLFLGDCLKNQLTKGIKESFFSEYNLSIADILDKVYRQPMPNRFLAGISNFIKENINDITIYNLVYKSFTDFFLKNVMHYDYKNNNVYFTGSIAYYFQDILKTIADEMNIKIASIVQSPMDGMIEKLKIES